MHRFRKVFLWIPAVDEDGVWRWWSAAWVEEVWVSWDGEHNPEGAGRYWRLKVCRSGYEQQRLDRMIKLK